MPRGDTNKTDKSSKQNGSKGNQKGQICNGTTLQIKYHKDCILHGKCTPFGLAALLI